MLKQVIWILIAYAVAAIAIFCIRLDLVTWAGWEGVMNLFAIFLLINLIILYFICYKQQKRIEFQKHRIDQLLLKIIDFIEHKD